MPLRLNSTASLFGHVLNAEIRQPGIIRAFGTSFRCYSQDGERSGGDRPPGPKAGSISRRIHILGLGNIGTFVAHSLATLPHPPPMTLLLHNENTYENWRKNHERITVRKNGLPEHKSGYDVNVLKDDTWFAPPSRDLQHGSANETAPVQPSHMQQDNTTIDNLILTVKTTQVENALQSVRHRLTPKSTILFMHNGMGVQDEVNQKIFPEPNTRPNYMLGIISHGLYRLKSFDVAHAGVGTTVLGIIQSNTQSTSLEGAEQQTSAATEENEADETKHPWAESSRYILKLLCRTPALVATSTNKTNLTQYQLEKLAMNAVVNPLTVMMDCVNGDLLYNYNVSRIQRLLLIEISAVISALPELQGVPGIQSRFSPERLRTMAVAIMKKTAENTSSMLQDTRAGKETEIDYMNGYIVRRGEELGIKCALNYMLQQFVLAKGRTASRIKSGHIPLDVADLK